MEPLPLYGYPPPIYVAGMNSLYILEYLNHLDAFHVYLNAFHVWFQALIG